MRPPRGSGIALVVATGGAEPVDGSVARDAYRNPTVA